MDQWLFSQTGTAIYFALAAVLILSAFGLPVPEDVALLLAGVLALQGKVDLWVVVAVCYCAVIVGDLCLYGLGYRFGAGLFKTGWFQARFSSDRILAVRKKLEAQSFLMIFLARHLFYLRSLTFLTCGALRVRREVFFFSDLLAAAISVPIMVGVGYYLAGSFENLGNVAGNIKLASLAFGALLLFGLLASRLLKSPTDALGTEELAADASRSVSDEKEEPDVRN